MLQLLWPGQVTLPHRPQFLQPYNELLGPRRVSSRERPWCWGEGRRGFPYHAGPWRSCTSPAQMLARSLCWNKDSASAASRSCPRNRPLLSHPSRTCHGLGGGGGLCTNPSSLLAVAALSVTPSREAVLWASLLPTLSFELTGPLPTPPPHPPQLQAPWSLLAAPAPPWEMAEGQPIRVRVQNFQKESEAQRG